MTNTINAYEVVAKVAQITAPFVKDAGFTMQVGQNGNVRVDMEIRKRYESLYIFPSTSSIKVIYKGYYENRDDFRKEMRVESDDELAETLSAIVGSWK